MITGVRQQTHFPSAIISDCRKIVLGVIWGAHGCQLNTIIATSLGHHVVVHPEVQKIGFHRGSDLDAWRGSRGLAMQDLLQQYPTTRRPLLLVRIEMMVCKWTRVEACVRVYVWDKSEWRQMGPDMDGVSPGDRFGRSLALCYNGRTVAMGSRIHSVNAGQLRVFSFKEADNVWLQVGQDIDGVESTTLISLATRLHFPAMVQLWLSAQLADAGQVQVFVLDNSILGSWETTLKERSKGASWDDLCLFREMDSL